MKAFGWIVMSSLAVFLVVTPTSWAQPTKDCENDRSIGACVGELLDEEFEMIVELEGMMGAMQAMGLFSFGPERFGLAAQGPDFQADVFDRINSLKNQHGRAVAVKDATPDEEFNELFEQGDTEKGKKCRFSDKDFVDSLRDEKGDLDLASIGLKSVGPKFDNGKCDIFNAVDLDDNNVKLNERKENMCERACSEKTVGGEKQKGKSKDRFVDDLQDGIAAARSGNQALVAQRAHLSELGLLLADLRLSKANFQFSPVHSDPCAPGTPGPGDDLIADRAFNIAITALDGTIVLGDVLAQILQFAKDIAQNPCKQTVAGFNASTACTPMVAIFHIAKGIVGVIKGVRTLTADARSIVATEAKIVRAFKADSAKACSKLIKDDFDGGQCVSGMCHGGPDDNSPCVNDSDCSDGAIVILQGAVSQLQGAAAQTNAELAALKAELALVKSLLEATRDLLLTPPGRREGFHP